MQEKDKKRRERERKKKLEEELAIHIYIYDCAHSLYERHPFIILSINLCVPHSLCPLEKFKAYTSSLD